jgi:hypothetical protein
MNLSKELTTSELVIEYYQCSNTLITESSSVVTLHLVLVMALHISILNAPYLLQINKIGSLVTMVILVRKPVSSLTSKLRVPSVSVNLLPYTVYQSTLHSIRDVMDGILLIMANLHTSTFKLVQESIVKKTSNKITPTCKARV